MLNPSLLLFIVLFTLFLTPSTRAQCDSGQFSNQLNANTCTDCPVGFKSATQYSCKRCLVGKFSNEPKSILCNICPTGKYQNLPGKTSCRKCAPGKDQPAETSIFCNKCEAGRIAKEQGTTRCPICSRGTYQNELSQRVCKECPTGYYGLDQTIRSSCVACPKGKYGVQPMRKTIDSCQNCRAGRFATITATIKSDDDDDDIPCKACSKGRYSQAIGMTKESLCEMCPSGYYNEKRGSSNKLACIACTKGKANNIFGSTNSEECLECEPGFSQSQTGSATCEPCPPGTSAPFTGMSACRACKLGKFQPEIASTVTDCTIAGIGSYAPQATTVLHVPHGFRATECLYENYQHNATGCADTTACPPGKYGAIPPGGKCFTCPPGTFSLQALTSCEACGKGRYQSLPSQDLCEKCPTGWVQPFPKQLSCEQCMNGTMAEVKGLLVCQECISGRFQPENTASTCHRCQVGYFQDTTKAIDCKKCVRGKHTANETGAKECWFVPPNKNCPAPMLDSLLSISRKTSDLRLSLRVGFDEIFNNHPKDPSRVDYLVIQYSTERNLADQKKAQEHPDWREFKTQFRQKIPVSLLMQSDAEDGTYGGDTCEEGEECIDEEDDEEEGDEEGGTGADSEVDGLNGMIVLANGKQVNENTMLLENFPGEFSNCDSICQQDLWAYGLPMNFTIRAHNDTIGPVWRRPIYLRASFILADGGTGRWTTENKIHPVTTDCREKEGVEYYLRTHKHDDTLFPPIDLLSKNTTVPNTNISVISAYPVCVKCPDGGSCNSQGITNEISGVQEKGIGLLLWEIAPKQGYWRIPWARHSGDTMNQNDEVIQAPPVWFHKCPHEEACLGVLPDDKFGLNGWEPTKTNNNHTSRLAILEHINQGRNWSSPATFPTTQCLHGTTGPLCATCADKFIRLNGRCVECYSEQTRFTALFVVLILLTIIFSMVRCCLRKLNSNALRAVRDISKIIIVVLNMCQVVTTIPNMVDVNWPNNVVEFLEQFDIVNFDLASLTGATCDNRINFHVQFTIMAICPIIVVFLALVIYWIENCKIHSRIDRMSRKMNATQLSPKAIVNKEKMTDKRNLELKRCYLDLFKVIDADASGDVNAKEMVKLLHLLGYIDPRINEHITLRLLHRIGGSMFADTISEDVFVDEMETGSLSDRLHSLLKFEDEVLDLDHSNLILKWNRRRKLISYSFSWAMQLLMLLHTPVSRKVMQFFDCVQIGDSGHQLVNPFQGNTRDFSLEKNVDGSTICRAPANFLPDQKYASVNYKEKLFSCGKLATSSLFKENFPWETATCASFTDESLTYLDSDMMAAFNTCCSDGINACSTIRVSSFTDDYSKSFLRADFSIQCQDSGENVDTYTGFMPYVITCMLFYTILLPISCALFLIYNRKKLYEPKTLMRMGWMYERLTPGAEWWDTHEIMRKLILCGFIVFFPPDPGIRASIALVICIVSQSLLNYLEPHRNKLVFWTEQLAMSVVVLLYAFAIVLRAEDLSEQNKQDLGAIVITAIICIIVCGCCTSLAALLFLRTQILKDQNTEMITSVKFKRALLKIEHHKHSVAVQKEHAVGSAMKTKRVLEKRIASKDRLSKRLRERHKVQGQTKIKMAEEMAATEIPFVSKKMRTPEKIKMTTPEKKKTNLSHKTQSPKNIPDTKMSPKTQMSPKNINTRILRLTAQKDQAVKDENYPEAGRLKKEIIELEAAKKIALTANDNTIELNQLDKTILSLTTQKDQAVKDENYPEAGRLKKEIAELEAKITKLKTKQPSEEQLPIDHLDFTDLDHLDYQKTQTLLKRLNEGKLKNIINRMSSSDGSVVKLNKLKLLLKQLQCSDDVDGLTSFMLTKLSSDNGKTISKSLFEMYCGIVETEEETGFDL